MKKIFHIVMLVLVMTAFAGTAFAAQKVEDLKGKPAPGWILKKPDGSSLNLKDLRGKVVLLDFWATWCGPCKAAMPSIQKIHETYAKKGVQVIGVNAFENDPAQAVDYMKQNKYTYGLLLGGDDVATQYGIEGIPTMIIIDKKGVVSEVRVGYDRNLEGRLSAILDSLLKTAN